MKFKKGDLAKIFQDLGNLEKIEDVRVKCLEIQKDFEADYEEHENVVSERDQLKVDVDDLQASNRKLFKMVGTEKEDKKDPDPEEKDTNNLKYEDLFNKEGELL